MPPRKSDQAKNLTAFGFGRGIIDPGSAYRDWNRQSAPEGQAPSMTLSEMKSDDPLAEERRGEEL